MIRALGNFRSFLPPYRKLLAAGALLGLIDIVLGLLQPWPLKFAVDDVVLGRTSSLLHVVLPSASREHMLLVVIVGLVAVVGLGALTDYWSTWFMESAGERVGNDVREALFAHLQRLSLRYHGQHHVGDLASRLTTDVDRLEDLLVQSLSVLLPNAFLVVGMVTLMLVVDPGFTVLALAGTPLMALGIYRATTDMKQATRRARRSGGEVSAIATEILGAIQVVQAFGLEEHSQARFRRLNRRSLQASLDALRFQARFSPMVDLTAVVSTGIALWFGINRVVAGRMTLGLLLVFLAYLGSLYKPIKALSRLAYVVSRGSASAERIAAILAAAPDVADRASSCAARAFTGGVCFRGVGFSYGRGEVLRGVDLAVEAGETVAIVGPSGAGKSTLVALVPRLYDPDRGSVEIDGTDVRRYSLSSLRAQVAVVLQEPVLFRGTIWENIAWGRPGATGADVARAICLAQVHEFADRLPEGLATAIGERGFDLSGGQRQRIAIARAIVRDAPILILDEPTSALDPNSEALVIKALRNLMRGRTTLVVAHRLSTSSHADRVVVMERGVVVEEGSHESLLARSGSYASLYGQSWAAADQGSGRELRSLLLK